MVYTEHEHKRLVLWVLVTAEVQGQVDAQHWPGGSASALPALPMPQPQPAPMRQELVIDGSLLDEGKVVLVLPETYGTLG